MILSHRIPLVVAGLVYLVVGPAACGSGAKTESELKSDIVSMMHTLMLGELQDLNQAALDLQAAAPPTFALGWDPAKDSGAQIDAMKEAWTRTRLHWERAEGPVAPMFSDLDNAIDSRYEDMIRRRCRTGDSDPFDGAGNDRHDVRDRTDPLRAGTAGGRNGRVEKTVAGDNYAAAAWPTSDAQAAEFKNGLCQRLVNDTQLLLNQWKTKSIDLAAVFTGLTGLISLQSEKVGLALRQ